MIQKTHQLSSRDAGSQRLLQTWPLQLKTCPEKPTGRSWASWQAAITDQYYWQSTCSTGPATQRPFPDGITRRPTGWCSLALQMSTARQLRLTTSTSTKPTSRVRPEDYRGDKQKSWKVMKIMIMIAFKGPFRDFLQSPHWAANCLQHVSSSGQGAIMCT